MDLSIFLYLFNVHISLLSIAFCICEKNNTENNAQTQSFTAFNKQKLQPKVNAIKNRFQSSSNLSKIFH